MWAREVSNISLVCAANAYVDVYPHLDSRCTDAKRMQCDSTSWLLRWWRLCIRGMTDSLISRERAWRLSERHQSIGLSVASHARLGSRADRSRVTTTEEYRKSHDTITFSAASCERREVLRMYVFELHTVTRTPPSAGCTTLAILELFNFPCRQQL